MLAERMQRSLGQAVVIENTVGAGGTIANNKVMQATPDGYTIEIGHIGTHVLAPAVQSLNVDYVNGFEPIAMVATNPEVIVSRPDFPAQDLSSDRPRSDQPRQGDWHGRRGHAIHIMAVEFGAGRAAQHRPLQGRGARCRT
jgi:tripartite-type tricarboxylate transporter receptor subunit TctC